MKEHIAACILDKCKDYSQHAAMRHKVSGQWQSTTYEEFAGLILSCAQALLEMGVKRGDMVGIFARNRPEWAIADLGILAVGAVSVPIYATNTQAQTEYIVNDAALRLIFVGDREQYEKVLSFRDKYERLQKIIVCDEVEVTADRTMCFADFLARGEQAGRGGEIDEHLARADTNDLATLIYTSGTTGEPKGVMLTHGNIFHQFKAVDKDFEISHKDSSLCFLPLSHSYERAWSYYIFASGATNCYVSDPRRVIEYLSEVKPTAMVSVPRLYEKIYTTAHEKLQKASPVKRAMFHWAVKTGKRYEYKRRASGTCPILRFKHRIADKLVLSKIRGIVGGHKNFFSAGGASLAGEIEEFFFAAGLLVCQGYGLTETAPVLTANNPHHFRFGTVGRPIEGVQLKIAPDGEILAKGPNVMKGYYNKPEATREAFGEDGWFKTGDVGEFDADGYLKITGRIKDLIITSGGKNIAPQHIESVVGQDHYIDQIVAIGDGRHFISALIVPYYDALEEWARDNGIEYSSRDELANHPAVQRFYRGRVEELSGDLGPYERVKKFTIISTEFSQEGGELTPTLKVKRGVVNSKYKDVIEKMYG